MKDYSTRLAQLKRAIFEINNRAEFNEAVLEVFHIQRIICQPYKEYINLLGTDISKIKKYQQVPFLPVSIFKNRDIICDGFPPQMVFNSSTTTGSTPSKHPVHDLSLYEESFKRSFKKFWGDPSDFTIYALLPNYLERENSSLVYMVNELISSSSNKESGFFLYNHQDLYNSLIKSKENGEKTMLIGVSFALLDFAERYNLNFPNLIVVETGGMKGRREEISRDELHRRLKSAFNVKKIASEYGMAELLSQAWSYGEGLFETPGWMRIVIRDLSNPFKMLNKGEIGGVNVIDLANIYSCAFIETQDLGLKKAGSLFTLHGRISGSELRGCNLLLAH